MRSRAVQPTATLPQQRRHRPAYQIALFVGLLLLLGLVVMYALGPQRANVMNHAYGTNYGDMFFFNKQLISVGISIAAFAACAAIPYRWFTDRLPRQLFIAGIVLSLLLVIAGAVLHLSIAKETNGAYRWFYLGGLGSFQPSELLKFGALVFVAGFLGRRAAQGKINDIQETLVPLGIAMITALGVVVVLQKDLGTGISLVAIVLAILVASGMKWAIIGKIAGALVVGAVLLTISSPHRVERVMTFLKSDSSHSQSADDNDYHIRQAYIAIGSGGLMGLGIGKSVQATGYLPEAINDSIFAVMGETFGFVGLVAILALFTALLLSLLRVAARLPDMHLRLVAAGVFGWVGSHVVMNVAAMTGVFPLTGIPLPLLSYGGTSMLFIAAALGLVFQLSAYTAHQPITEEAGDGKNLGSRRRIGRTRYAGRGGF
ncbi:MAG: FtsW/RodA/SpoVE family cell cycle protein [Candidatus Saccharibacteria bacterium]|nr:FtsW/RodA/SpoVE family cell cycle protein [Candidatus Saccharibacteria bacterium]